MFAFHTPTRMKGSAVVQSLKSWASKLHPQLALSPKESQRLLTALTSSFRQHLDKAHPSPSSGEDARPKLEKASALNTGKHEVHSFSAAFADKHLTSVLTNPLLARDAKKQPILDATSAKIALYKDPTRDPISLLLEYREKGAATVPVAVVCLQKFIESVNSLPEAKRQKAVLETQAGKRTLLWVLENKLHETDIFADDKRLIDAMIPLIIQEGFEDYLWEWVQLDVRSKSQEHPKYRRQPSRLYWPYRWKGYVFSSIIRTKLEASRNNSADAALDAFFKANGLRARAGSNHMEHTFPIMQPFLALVHAFTRTVHGEWTNPWRNTDAAQYDRFSEDILGTRKDHRSRRLYQDWYKALLLLFHPRKPSPSLALRYYRELFAANPSDAAREHLKDYDQSKPEQWEKAFYHYMLRTAMLLQEEGSTQDAEWILDKIRQSYPRTSRDIESRLKKIRDDERKHAIHKAAESSYSVGVPFPTFV